MLGSLSKYSGCHSIRVSHEGSFWAKGSSGIVYSIAEIIEMITFLIGNSYVKAFGGIFCQTKVGNFRGLGTFLRSRDVKIKLV